MNNKFVLKSEFIIKILFVFLSIMCMNAIAYLHIGIVYKLFTILNFAIIIFAIIGNFKLYIHNIYFKLISIFVVAQTITVILNYNENLLGNLIEVAFMIVYLLNSFIISKDNRNKLFLYIAYITQFISFIASIFTVVVVLSHKTICFYAKDTDVEHYMGVHNGRIFGVVNPNALAIFTFISIVLAFILIQNVNSKYKKLLSINIFLQSIHFLLLQSRGAVLSVVVMILIYGIFIKFDNGPKYKINKKIIFTAGFLVIFLIIVIASNIVLNEVFDAYKTTTLKYDENFTSLSTKEISKKEGVKSRIVETGSSGRKGIWLASIKIIKTKPIMGHGIRNVSDYYKKYFDKHTRENSLNGGGLHNIFLTVLAVGGIINFLIFMMIIGYISCISIKYLYHGKCDEVKLTIMLFFGILFGQLFESTILYSTNFINILFWIISADIVYYAALNNSKNSNEKAIS